MFLEPLVGVLCLLLPGHGPVCLLVSYSSPDGQCLYTSTAKILYHFSDHVLFNSGVECEEPSKEMDCQGNSRRACGVYDLRVTSTPDAGSR